MITSHTLPIPATHRSAYPIVSIVVGQMELKGKKKTTLSTQSSKSYKSTKSLPKSFIAQGLKTRKNKKNKMKL
jgi:hypothetical protein